MMFRRIRNALVPRARTNLLKDYEKKNAHNAHIAHFKAKCLSLEEFLLHKALFVCYPASQVLIAWQSKRRATLEK
jgi:hypothetical protein